MLAPREPLEKAERFGAIGDIHGNLDRLFPLLDAFADRGVRTLVALGDVGILWPGRSPEMTILALSVRLGRNGQTFYWVDGNHDSYPILRSFSIGDDGLRRLTQNVIHLPRGYRTVLASGLTVAALGGANSIDREFRSRLTWWPQESITEEDLARLGDAHADVLVGHDAPLDVLALDAQLKTTDRFMSEAGLAYARKGRQVFHRGFLQVSPQLSLSGHYHYPVSETVGYYDRERDRGFATRVVVLDSIQHSTSAAIVDAGSLGIQFLTSTGDSIAVEEPLKELFPSMRGRWDVHSLHSVYRLDLDAGTVERISGPLWSETTTDGVHRLRTLELCEIGQPMRFTMPSQDFCTDYLWHQSSVVRHIVQAPDSVTRTNGKASP